MNIAIPKINECKLKNIYDMSTVTEMVEENVNAFLPNVDKMFVDMCLIIPFTCTLIITLMFVKEF